MTDAAFQAWEFRHPEFRSDIAVQHSRDADQRMSYEDGEDGDSRVESLGYGRRCDLVHRYAEGFRDPEAEETALQMSMTIVTEQHTDPMAYLGHVHVLSGLSNGTGWRSLLVVTPSLRSFSRDDLRTSLSRRPMAKGSSISTIISKRSTTELLMKSPTNTTNFSTWTQWHADVLWPRGRHDSR